MDAKTTYETAAQIADALPEAQREVFADLLDALTEPMAMEYRRVRRAVAVRRWLRDAGWITRR